MLCLTVLCVVLPRWNRTCCSPGTSLESTIWLLSNPWGNRTSTGRFEKSLRGFCHHHPFNSHCVLLHELLSKFCIRVFVRVIFVFECIRCVYVLQTQIHPSSYIFMYAKPWLGEMFINYIARWKSWAWIK